MTTTWSRLIRFSSSSTTTTATTHFGDPILTNTTDPAAAADELTSLLKQGQLYAIRLEGTDPFSLVRTEERVKVSRLLGVLDVQDVAVFKCIGLNYQKHSK